MGILHLLETKKSSLEEIEFKLKSDFALEFPFDIEGDGFSTNGFDNDLAKAIKKNKSLKSPS